MKKNEKLSRKMTLEEFEKGYFYAEEIKKFAKEIGIKHHNKFRKDELEIFIRDYLRTGKLADIKKTKRRNSGETDLDKGLDINLPVTNYVGNKETKDFILKEALKIDPSIKQKSGSRYRLNRWREEQLEKGRDLTYGDIVRQFIVLNKHEGSFERIESGRYINFLSDFSKFEKNFSREDALKAWKELKELDVPKTYEDWKKYKSSGVK